VQQYRTPNVWVSLWAPADIWSYLAIYVCGLWATARIWQMLNRQLRWILLALPLAGILSVPMSYIALERLAWYLVPQIQPAQALMFTLAFSSMACGIAGGRAALARKKWEASLWFCVVFALPLNSRILNLLPLDSLRVAIGTNLLELAACFALALAVGITVSEWGKSRWRYASLLVPVLAVLVIPHLADSHIVPEKDGQSMVQLADWAEASTWGSSMFLFPDAGRDSDPGAFRADSRRAVWVDWTSGALVDGLESVAAEWWERWQQTMQGKFSAERLQNMLSLPIDYYVLKRSNRLEAVRPVFLNRRFIVYDAADLRRAVAPLRLANTIRR